MNPRIKSAVLVLNTLGFAGYLVWLSSFDAPETLRSQNGIIFYVPCIPFLFTYLLLLAPKAAPKGKPWWQSDEDYEQEQAKKRQAAAAAGPPPPARLEERPP